MRIVERLTARQLFLERSSPPSSMTPRKPHPRPAIRSQTRSYARPPEVSPHSGHLRTRCRATSHVGSGLAVVITYGSRAARSNDRGPHD